MKEDFLTFTVDVRPVPKYRPRTGKNGQHYTPEVTRTYETRVGWAARAALHGRPRNEADDLSVSAVFNIIDRQRCDVDNLAKTLLDGMNGIVWRDDNQVTELHARLIRGADHNGTDVTISIVGKDTRGKPAKPRLGLQLR